MMKNNTSLFLLLQLLLISNLYAQHEDHTSEYAGQEQREVKTLSAVDIEELENGRGWGLAKAAELNGYPGPAHLLDMKKEVELSEEQLQKIEDLYSRMKSRAVPLGKKFILLERKLNNVFADESIKEEQLEDLLDQIGGVYAKLRYVHLKTHLEAVEILTDDQVALYIISFAATIPAIPVIQSRKATTRNFGKSIMGAGKLHASNSKSQIPDPIPSY